MRGATITTGTTTGAATWAAAAAANGSTTNAATSTDGSTTNAATSTETTRAAAAGTADAPDTTNAADSARTACAACAAGRKIIFQPGATAGDGSHGQCDPSDLVNSHKGILAGGARALNQTTVFFCGRRLCARSESKALGVFAQVLNVVAALLARGQFPCFHRCFEGSLDVANLARRRQTECVHNRGTHPRR